MKTRILRATGITLALLAATPAAADGGDAWISKALPNVLVVQSDGKSYTKLDTPIIGDFVLRGRLEFDTGATGGVKSWTAWPVIETGYGIGQELANPKSYKVSKSYGVGSRPDSISKAIEFSIPYSVIEPMAVGMCAFKAFKLREDGKSDKQIFGQDHEVSFEIAMGRTVDSTGAGSGNQVWEYSENLHLPVRCAKWEGAQVPQGGNGDLTEGFRVLSATLELTEVATANGVCKVKTAAALRGNMAGETIKFRYFHSSGKKSAVFSVKTAGNKIAVINRNWDVPNENGSESGWFWIEGVGDTPFKTDKETYGMDCKGKSVGDLTLGN